MTTKTKRAAISTPAGRKILAGLREIEQSLKTGDTSKLTIRTVVIPEPAGYDQRAVRQLRDRLGLSQGLFAQLVGVSKKLVESWEAGTRTPAPMACRLLDAIARDPGSFFLHTRAPAA